MATKKEAKENVLPEASAGLNLRLGDEEFTVYEKARIIGSRALQLSQGAKPLLKLSKKDYEEVSYNPIEIAKMEFDKGVIPLTIKRSLPHEKAKPVL